jgi:hypothetical protein
MKPIGETRRINLELLITQTKTLDALALLAGTSPIYLSQLRHRAVDSKTGKPREMGTAMARRLEVACGKEVGWLDQERSQEPFSNTTATVKWSLSDDEAALLAVYRGHPQKREFLRGYLAGAANSITPSSPASRVAPPASGGHVVQRTETRTFVADQMEASLQQSKAAHQPARMPRKRKA